MSDIFEQMIAQHTIAGDNDRKNALYEVMQQVVLSGLYRGGFFKEAAFYGGTCLRIFHGLRRYSEDMDFSLLEKNPDFTLETYFPAIQTEKTLKIKIEVDTNPPLEFATEQKLLMLPFSFTTRCFTLPDLYAGKMHALTFRAWKNRIKGRDWYDFEWYVRNRVALDFEHLRVRTKEFNDIDLTKELFLELLKERISKADINAVKADVIPYIIDKRELDIWSSDYFLQLADMIVFK